MTTLSGVINDVLLTLYGYGLNQPRASRLTQPASSSATTLTVADASNFTQGIAELGSELVFIESVDVAGGTLTISPDGRGYFGTTAASYSAGQRVEMAPTWPRLKVKNAINDAIVNTYPDLWGVATTSFTFNPSVSTYALPAACERVLAVTADTIGPSREQVRINRFSEDNHAPTAEFASGKSITLERGPFPGRAVNVTYATLPVAISEGDSFTTSGLRESAILAVKYAATSHLLAQMDSARLGVETAVADEYDPSKAGIGTAMRQSAQLYQRYLMELDREKSRLVADNPTLIKLRTR